MVLTPQLLQAIKLLQMPNAELAAFIEGELERNPLLERAEDAPAAEAPGEGGDPRPPADAVEPGDWASESLESDPVALAQNLGTEIDNAFDPDRAATPLRARAARRRQGLSATSWTGMAARGGDGGRAGPRGLCRCAGHLERASDPAGDDRAQVSRSTV